MNPRRAGVDLNTTNAFRVIHGASDGEPGWYVDRLGDFVFSQSERPPTPAQIEKLMEVCRSLGCRGAYHKILERDAGLSGPSARSVLVLGETAPARFPIRESGVFYELSFCEGGSVGLFLDQRENRNRLLRGAVGQSFRLGQCETDLPLAGKELLNAFAYTCGFSVCAALAGAYTCSLDLSRKYLEWGKRNFAANHLDPTVQELIRGDVFDWLGRFKRRRRAFDILLLDPPTFSRSRESGVFRAEKDYAKLVSAAVMLVRPGGVLFCSTNAAGWHADSFLAAVSQAVHQAGRKVSQRQFCPQPPDFPVSRQEPAYLKTVWLRV